MTQVQDEQCQWDGRDGEIGQAAGEKQGQPVGEVIDGFEQELADIAILDIRSDLPIVLVDGGQGVDNGHEQVIGDHFGEGVRPDGGPGRFAFINGAPHVEDGHERDEAEHGSRQKIEPVGQIILDPDVEDVPVLFHRPITRGSGARSGSIN